MRGHEIRPSGAEGWTPVERVAPLGTASLDRATQDAKLFPGLPSHSAPGGTPLGSFHDQQYSPGSRGREFLVDQNRSTKGEKQEDWGPGSQSSDPLGGKPFGMMLTHHIVSTPPPPDSFCQSRLMTHLHTPKLDVPVHGLAGCV